MCGNFTTGARLDEIQLQTEVFKTFGKFTTGARLGEIRLHKGGFQTCGKNTGTQIDGIL